MIIAINGRIGSGKDTVGRIIQYLIRCKQNDGFRESVPLEDTLGLTLSDPYHSGWEIKKFAAKLKQIASLLTGIPAERFEDQDFKKTELGPEWSSYVGEEQEIAMWGPKPMVVREFLQKLGTEGIRNNIHTNAWVNALFADYTPKGETWGVEGVDAKFPNWIITDCRFPNEAKAIKDRNGINIRVTRPGENLADLHPSETSLDSYQFDHIIENNGTKEELVQTVKKYLLKEDIL